MEALYLGVSSLHKEILLCSYKTQQLIHEIIMILLVLYKKSFSWKYKNFLLRHKEI